MTYDIQIQLLHGIAKKFRHGHLHHKHYFRSTKQRFWFIVFSTHIIEIKNDCNYTISPIIYDHFFEFVWAWSKKEMLNRYIKRWCRDWLNLSSLSILQKFVVNFSFCKESWPRQLAPETIYCLAMWNSLIPAY